MAKYEVIKPWHGVNRGDIVEIETLHPSLKANVRPLSPQVVEKLTVAVDEKPKGTKK